MRLRMAFGGSYFWSGALHWLILSPTDVVCIVHIDNHGASTGCWELHQVGQCFCPSSALAFLFLLLLSPLGSFHFTFSLPDLIMSGLILNCLLPFVRTPRTVSVQEAQNLSTSDYLDAASILFASAFVLIGGRREEGRTEMTR
jgi:hypothetical protein